MRQVVAAARSSSTATSSLECRNEARVGQSHPRVMSHAARPRRAPQADITLRARPQHCGIGAVPFCLPAPLSLPDLHTSLCPPREGVTHRARHAWLGVLLALLRHSVHHPLLAHSHAHAHTHALAQTRLHTHGHAHKNAGTRGAGRAAQPGEARGAGRGGSHRGRMRAGSGPRTRWAPAGSWRRSGGSSRCGRRARPG